MAPTSRGLYMEINVTDFLLFGIWHVGMSWEDIMPMRQQITKVNNHES